MRKLVRIGSNVKIPGDSHYKNKNIVLTLLKKIEMRKMTMPNFCINFLNKAAKLLPILYDFTVASLVDAWIKIENISYTSPSATASHPSWMRGLKLKQEENQILTGHVASLVDAWIKIMPPCLLAKLYAVASLADAWIKINNCTQNF